MLRKVFLVLKLPTMFHVLCKMSMGSSFVLQKYCILGESNMGAAIKVENQMCMQQCFIDC